MASENSSSGTTPENSSSAQQLEEHLATTFDGPKFGSSAAIVVIKPFAPTETDTPSASEPVESTTNSDEAASVKSDGKNGGSAESSEVNETEEERARKAAADEARRKAIRSLAKGKENP